ncbi:uncharacterized protein OCT59_021225 [Rhizophagus irregularis]|uniref:Kinase-like domain-containing protein n=2 Tax=Rhizophagus irregularis TaxID=588596 RepID=U9UD19_RHIID|nr:kinase-like domain-containing protein [Rhizophagus irregularis DAOM 181602=DAOM 197198]EXX53478.1 polo kinase CDC5 [Rhizophagus irregularis DAOM 197198w]POG81483.1 kinase-like domain-containing protein [Rhizophagus irregularis DAOM 181602=DAOM 197198]UZO02746.1 hypothetical protein OCT59_021225 [Rhizophagus irregularis]GBC27211.1 kinase-like domain-containing protein [Rhizophagus irregularis DAOM 181602=DAOM 197198]|eukprot:XP_025188349.1 kinase-like domain-containing protein [Rhizophagus irregularis DAOM 181602=DAOM 197198]
MSLREFFELKEKNPHINCNFRIDNEFPNTLNPKRIRYPNSLKLEHDSLLAAKCNLNLPYICENCLHIILQSKFSSWTSGNELIDCFIQVTQLFSSYERYPEWVPYNSLSQIKKIGEGGFGTVFSATWSWGIKSLEEEEYIEDYKTKKKIYHYRSGPCTVALKKLKGDMEITQAFLSEVQAQFDFCHLYGITQDPSTLEYLFIMRFAPQGDLRRYLLLNFDNLSLPNKLGIAQTICAELKKIHAKGWVHGDLHSGNILLLNEEYAFISDFGLCRPIDEVESEEKIESEEKLYGVIPNVAPEMFYGKQRSQEGDIYSLGVILWELMCGIIAFADRPHNESLVLDIVFNGLRPQTCHFAPPVYNDLLKRCWDQDSSKRPSIYEVTDFIEELCECRIRDKEKIRDDTVGGNLFKSPEKIGKLSPLYCQLSNSHNSGRIYNLMKWKPNKPTHMEAVYTSRLLSYKEYLLSRSKE